MYVLGGCLVAQFLMMSCHAFPIQQRQPQRRQQLFKLQMSLKPAAVPLMDSGKALARSGELLIDLTSDLQLYGGALSASGALLRNAGDALAQAAALCRFKTGAELACDEIREAATCLNEAVDKLSQAKREALVDKDTNLAQALGTLLFVVVVDFLLLSNQCYGSDTVSLYCPL
jgi:hypothetical protein